jgi:hypothetical protein
VFLPSENIRLGMHFFNPIPGSWRKNNLPVTISTGAGIELSETLFAAIEAEMSTGSNIDIRTGVEYQAVKKLWLRAGFGTLNNSFCFGTGYQFGIVTLDLGFSTHDRLGISSAVSLIFKIK